MLRHALALALAVVSFACSSSSGGTSSSGGSSSGGSSSGATSSSGGSSSGGTSGATGTCTASGATTGSVAVSAMCSNQASANGGWAVTVSTQQAPGDKTDFGGNFGFPEQPVKGKAYVLADATLVIGFGTFFSYSDSKGLWLAGDLTKLAPTNGSASVHIDDCSPVAHGSLTATLPAEIDKTLGDVTVTCTF
jgi:hypothetical protein